MLGAPYFERVLYFGGRWPTWLIEPVPMQVHTQHELSMDAAGYNGHFGLISAGGGSRLTD